MLIATFGESFVSRIQVQLWYYRFKVGLEDVNANARSDRRNTSTTNENIEAVKKIISDNCRITIREVKYDIGISFGSCQAIFMDVLGMKRKAANIVPKLLKF